LCLQHSYANIAEPSLILRIPKFLFYPRAFFLKWLFLSRTFCHLLVFCTVITVLIIVYLSIYVYVVVFKCLKAYEYAKHCYRWIAFFLDTIIHLCFFKSPSLLNVTHEKVKVMTNNIVGGARTFLVLLIINVNYRFFIDLCFVPHN